MTTREASRPLRVLYIQRPKGGGSTTTLLEMMGNLRDVPVDPTVLFFGRNRYEGAFAELGIPYHCLSERSGAGGGKGAHDLGPYDTATLERMASEPGGDRGRLGSSLREMKRLLRKDLPASLALREYLKTHTFDLVHANDNPRGDRAALLAAIMCRMPVISHVRFSHAFDTLVDGAISRGVDHYVYVSRAARDRFESIVGDHARGTVLYDPLTIPPRAQLEERGRKFRRVEGLEDAALVVNVSRIVPWKGLHVFVAAMAEVVRQHPTAVGLIVGDPENDARYADYLQDLAVRLGLADRVRFTGFRPDALSIMAAADMVVHSAVKPEPFGRVVIEAMALGRPIIASAAGGPLESVRSGIDGLLTPPGDVRALAGAVDRLLRSPQLSRRLGDEASREVARRYTSGTYVDALLDIYHNAVGRDGSQPSAAERRVVA